ncbi:preprotein translocase subunit SecG [Mycoplasmopsis gallinarum]|uniref:preprotein translocase subunit SecG n=1 Tax=Mycoplasmopsis gallinarum TaxID=29557 RepID=UPI00056B3034|nr:preprotein translocase subunit SecG [Mycoplasmopsis gallinarum]
MLIAITTLLIIVSIFIIVISLLMSPDSNGFSGALVGSADLELFKTSKERGFKKVLKYSMIIAGFILLLFSIVIRIWIK